jgi:Ca-activated chloride channel family protein
MRLAHVESLHLLWLAAAICVFLYWGARQREAQARRLGEPDLLARLTQSASPRRRLFKAVLFAIAVVMIVLGLARPQWNPRPVERAIHGRDVVFVVDVSRSMLAEDLKPNRLERAKLAIMDALDQLQGDRVGLVAFAGTAVVKCPLTIDYGFFQEAVNDLSVNSVARGGTLIGDALRAAVHDVLDRQGRRHKDVVLITDGEDQESFPVEAAGELGQRDIRLIAIGLGSEKEGEPVPAADGGFMRYGGDIVRTQLDAETLREMAAQTAGGAYLNVATGAFDLGAIYAELIAEAEQGALEQASVVRYQERFQVFLAAALLLFTVEPLLSERRKTA